MLCACLLQSDIQGVCPPVAGPSVFPLISKTFLHLAQIHGRLLTSSSASLKLLIRDCTQYRRPSRQSDWTFMSSSMRLDIGTCVFGCNDDGVVLLFPAQFIQDAHNDHSMLLAVLRSLWRTCTSSCTCEDVTYRSSCSLNLVIRVVCSDCSTLLHTAQIPAETVVA